jgi:hypothetical protein
MKFWAETNTQCIVIGDLVVLKKTKSSSFMCSLSGVIKKIGWF